MIARGAMVVVVGSCCPRTMADRNKVYTVSEVDTFPSGGGICDVCGFATYASVASFEEEPEWFGKPLSWLRELPSPDQVAAYDRQPEVERWTPSEVA